MSSERFRKVLRHSVIYCAVLNDSETFSWVLSASKSSLKVLKAFANVFGCFKAI